MDWHRDCGVYVFVLLSTAASAHEHTGRLMMGNVLPKSFDTTKASSRPEYLRISFLHFTTTDKVGLSGINTSHGSRLDGLGSDV